MFVPIITVSGAGSKLTNSYYRSTARPQASVFSARLGIIRCSPEAHMIACCVRSPSIERNQTITFFHVLSTWPETSRMLKGTKYWRVFYNCKALPSLTQSLKPHLYLIQNSNCVKTHVKCVHKGIWSDLHRKIFSIKKVFILLYTELLTQIMINIW